MATAGGLVFYGTLDGRIKAADAESGRILWQFRAASGIVARPASFEGRDGHQYLAVAAGSGGLTSTHGEKEIDARDATAAHGLAALFGSMPPPAEASGVLYLFRLP